MAKTGEAFEQIWLPLWPLASDALEQGIYRQPRDAALTRRYLEANPKALANLLVVDVDHPDAALRALSARGSHPMPNFIAENPANGHAHCVWALETPVTTTEYAHRKPLAYLASCTEGLRRAVDGDRSYAGLMTKNPTHPAWRVDWRCDSRYRLAEIESELGKNMPPKGWQNSRGYREAPTPLSRNCHIFNSVRSWAYRPALMRKYLPTRDSAGLAQAVYAEIYALNSLFPRNELCEGPLPDADCRAIARSIHRWIVTRSRIWSDGIAVYEAALSARQAAIGRRSAVARRAAADRLAAQL